MIWLGITFFILIYILIGGFLSGAFERELSPLWVLAWPVLLIILAAMVIAKIPVDLGRKHYNKVTKWFDDHI